MMANLKAKFMGRWSDETGRLLVIKKAGNIILADVLIGQDKLPATRDLIGNEKLPSVNMKTYFDCGRLNIELGTEGLGPFLQLEYRNNKVEEALVPTVFHGLYDEWEDDFGVSWVFPLSLYKRAKNEKVFG